jgi:hypothetical protein
MISEWWIGKGCVRKWSLPNLTYLHGRSKENHDTLANQNFVHISNLTHARYMPRPSPPSFSQSNNIWWNVQIMELLIMQFSQAPVTLYLLGPNVLRTLYSNILNLCPSLKWKTRFRLYSFFSLFPSSVLPLFVCFLLYFFLSSPLFVYLPYGRWKWLPIVTFCVLTLCRLVGGY